MKNISVQNQKWAEKFIFALYLLGFVTLAISLAIFQPLADTPPLYGNPPDEHARFLVPKYICNHGVLPTGLEEELRIPGYGSSYGLYTVFPYIVQGYVMRLVNVFTDSELTLLYSARMVNVLFGTMMAVVVYLIGKKIFKDFRFRWLFCFAVMYLPESLFVHTYVNTDSCCMLATSMMVYGLIGCYREDFNRRNRLWMEGGIILCALSYYNAYGYILSCILLFLAYFLRKKDGRFVYDWRQMLEKGLKISAVVLLGIGWWFIRSYIVLDGDILGLATLRSLGEQYGVAGARLTYHDMGYSIWQMMEAENSISGTFISFVAMYGSMSIWAGNWLYRCYKLFFAAGFLGLFYHLCTGGRLRGHRLFFHANMVFCILMPVGLLIYYAYNLDYQNQGRYLLPMLVPFMYYMVKGIEKLAGLHWKQYRLPCWLVNAGVVFCFCIFLCGTVDMVYFRALPVFLETGMVM